MSDFGAVVKRMMGVLDSSSLRVVPAGDMDVTERGIVKAVANVPSRLGDAVKMAFAGVVLAAAVALPAHAGPNGVAGYDAGVYSSSRTMQQGSAVPMTVINVRPVHIELEQQQKYGQVSDYATTAGTTALGAMLGSKVGSGNGQKAAMILGGMMGAGLGDALNTPLAKYVEGFEIAMVNPGTNQMTVVTQAGAQQFREGDPVLVISSGGSSRVIADHSRGQAGVSPQRGVQYQPSQPMQPMQPMQGQDNGFQRVSMQGNAPVQAGSSGERPAYVEGLLKKIMRSADEVGIRVDSNKVADMLESGKGAESGMFVGKVVAVDKVMGLVYQDVGRGVGAVHVADLLSQVPKVGDLAIITFKGAVGSVEVKEKGVERNLAHRGR